MKKIVSVILLSSILLTGNFAFVQGSTLANSKSNIAQTNPNYRARLAEITPLQEEVRTNRSKIINSKLQAKAAYNKAKSNLKELIKNKDSLTPLQIESLKKTLIVLQNDQQIMSSTIGEIEKETIGLRTGKSKKNFEEVRNSLNNIIKIQNARIKELQNIIDDFNQAANV